MVTEPTSNDVKALPACTLRVNEAGVVLSHSSEDDASKLPRALSEWPAEAPRITHYMRSAARLGRGVQFIHRSWHGDAFAQQRVSVRCDRADEYEIRIEDCRGDFDMDEHESLLAAVAAHARDVILVTEAEPIARPGPRVLYANPAFTKMTGYPREEILGKTPRLLQTAKTNSEELRRLKSCLERWQPCRVELLNARKDGSTFWVELDIVPISDETGWYTYWLSIQREVTERRTAARERERIARLESLGQLGAGIAHDFNNKLSALAAHIALTRDLLKDGEDVEELFKTSEEIIRSASLLSKQLLVFARGGDPILRPIAVTSLVLQAVDFALRGSSLQAVFEPSTDMYVQADEGQLSQVISNLVLNARDASPVGASLEVAIEGVTIPEGSDLLLPSGRYVRMTFRDHGSGMTPEVLEHAFEPYYTTKRDGNGIGLSVCYSVVRSHGGSLRLKSSPGEGTTAIIDLPRIDATASSMQDDRLVPEDDSGLRVLILEDEPGLRATLQRLLERRGHTVEVAPRGERALELAHEAERENRPYDVALLDVTIVGGLGALEIAEPLRELPSRPALVVMSGYSSAGGLSRYVELGFDAAIGKPFVLSELEGVLMSCRKRAR